MSPNTRAVVLAALSAGQTNRAIALDNGVTVNAVAGLRGRNFASTMTQAEARALPKSYGYQREQRLASEATVLEVLRGGEALTCQQVHCRIARPLCERVVYRVLHNLAEHDVICRIEGERPALWHLRR